jgi:hypothetical protein
MELTEREKALLTLVRKLRDHVEGVRPNNLLQKQLVQEADAVLKEYKMDGPRFE